MKVSEIFHSIQGEGLLAGVVSVFVRLAGCDLRCRWCDTAYAMEADQAQELGINEIVEKIESYECGYVVVTGGEPMAAAELPAFLSQLKEHKKHITVETSATRYREIDCDLISISPKLANSTPSSGAYAQSHEKHRLNIEAIQQYIGRHNYQLKFVVEDETDLAEVEQVLGALREVDRNKVMLMPQGCTREQLSRSGPEIAEMCIEHGYRYCPRLQIELWGNHRGR